VQGTNKCFDEKIEESWKSAVSFLLDGVLKGVAEEFSSRIRPGSKKYSTVVFPVTYQAKSRVRKEWQDVKKRIDIE
jgi:hypothetical protein